jgi:hypothetical protein
MLVLGLSERRIGTMDNGGEATGVPMFCRNQSNELVLAAIKPQAPM